MTARRKIRRRNQLVVMVRAPRLGTVKRRLARDIGAVGALRFYRFTTAALLRRLSSDKRWALRLAVTPDRTALVGRGLWPLRVPLVPQGPGDLGARMGRQLRWACPGPVVIVGSDIPAIGPQQIASAFRALGNHDWVLGPAPDGGYWLIGAARRRSPDPAFLRVPFAGVRWSSPTTRADTLAWLDGARVAFLEELQDVDRGADLAKLRSGS